MALSGCKSIPGAAPKAEMMADPWVKARDVGGVSEKDLYTFEFPELKYNQYGMLGPSEL